MTQTALPHFHVAGVLVQAAPAHAEAVAASIAGIAGARVHASESGKLVVTLESEESASILDGLNRLQCMQGVLSAVLVSEYSVPLTAADEVIPHEPSFQEPA